MSAKVLAFGEALMDMLARPKDSGTVSFAAHPGGAPANVAVGVAKLGGAASFVGQVGRDMFGDSLRDSMARFGVDTGHLVQTREAKTALAFVSLDSNGERSFAFYRDRSADLLYRAEQCPASVLNEAAVFHCGSNTLTEPDIRDTHLALMARARNAGCVLSFDVNYRSALWPPGADAAGVIFSAMAASDLVKLSREELEALYGCDPDIPTRLVAAGVKLVLITDGAEPIEVHLGSDVLWLRPPETRVVDTTAAGDAFVAGLLWCLAQEVTGAMSLGSWLSDRQRVERALAFASRCGAHAVSRYGAFEALPRASELA